MEWRKVRRVDSGVWVWPLEVVERMRVKRPGTIVMDLVAGLGDRDAKR